MNQIRLMRQRLSALQDGFGLQVPKNHKCLAGGVICAIMLDMEYRLSKDIAALL